MSFGRPGGFDYARIVSPPDRGSFPLDHDGECTSLMNKYMECLKANKATATECRSFSKDYLQCRMDNGLMVKDDMSNLGFQDEESNQESSSPTTSDPDAKVV